MCFWCRKLLVQKACCRHAVTILPAQNHGFSFCSRMLSVFHTEDECFMWEHEVSGKCFLTLDDREPAAPTVDRLCGVGRALPAGLPQASLCCFLALTWEMGSDVSHSRSLCLEPTDRQLKGITYCTCTGVEHEKASPCYESIIFQPRCWIFGFCHMIWEVLTKHWVKTRNSFFTGRQFRFGNDPIRCHWISFIQ